jgi:hypothetical protein
MNIVVLFKIKTSNYFRCIPWQSRRGGWPAPTPASQRNVFVQVGDRTHAKRHEAGAGFGVRQPMQGAVARATVALFLVSGKSVA